MLRSAKELKKEMNVSRKYLDRVTNQINRFKNKGKVIVNAGFYSCSEAELELALKELDKNGYNYHFGRNSHNVKTLIVTW
jgi:hypothetical protein